MKRKKNTHINNTPKKKKNKEKQEISKEKNKKTFLFGSNNPKKNSFL